MLLTRPAAALLTTVVAMATGCVGPQRAFEEVAYAWEAKRAYKATVVAPATAEVSRHYERGWRHGYAAVALGRDTCPPATPPHAYLGKKYQCPDGRSLVRLWYRGYEDGVVAARGCGHGQRLVVNEAPCCDDCRGACLAPVTGVLPDPRIAMATQTGINAAPTPAYVQPTAAAITTVIDEPELGTEGVVEDLGYTPSETTPILFPNNDPADPVGGSVESAELIDAEATGPSLEGVRESLPRP